MILGSILTAALVNNLTPQLAGLDATQGPALVRAVMFQLAFPMLLAFGTLAVTARWWVDVLFFGLTGDSVPLAVALVPVMCAIFGINVLASAGVAGHYARGQFLFVEAVQLGVALVVVCFAASIADTFGIFGFACLLLVRAAVSFLVVGFRFVRADASPVQQLTKMLWARMAQIIWIDHLQTWARH